MTNNKAYQSDDYTDYDSDDVVVAVKEVLGVDVVYTSNDDAEHYFWFELGDEDKYDAGADTLYDMFSNEELEKVYEYLVKNCDTWF